MDAITVRNSVTVVIALISAVMCFSYAFTKQRRKAKKPVYGMAGIVFLYFATVYGIGVFDHSFYLLRSGWLGAIGQFSLAVIFGMLWITDCDWWRRKL